MLWSDVKVQESLKLTRNKPVYDKLAKQMTADGFPPKSVQQLKDKLRKRACSVNRAYLY